MTFYYSKYQKIGQFTCLAVFILGMVYAATTLLGFLSLKSPAEPIGNPYFTIMEVLTILVAPLMAISMVAVHAYASPVDKIYSLAALLFMCLMTGITSSVHFIMLTGSQQAQVAQHADFRFFFSFKWISVAYALDILAWDWFFALSFLLASFLFKSSREEKLLQKVMMISSILSLVGLMGVPLNNMQIRNIGILGYAGIAPFAFLWIGKILGQPKAPVS